MLMEYFHIHISFLSTQLVALIHSDCDRRNTTGRRWRNGVLAETGKVTCSDTDTVSNNVVTATAVYYIAATGTAPAPASATVTCKLVF